MGWLGYGYTSANSWHSLGTNLERGLSRCLWGEHSIRNIGWTQGGHSISGAPLGIARFEITSVLYEFWHSLGTNLKRGLSGCLWGEHSIRNIGWTLGGHSISGAPLGMARFKITSVTYEFWNSLGTIIEMFSDILPGILSNWFEIPQLCISFDSKLFEILWEQFLKDYLNYLGDLNLTSGTLRGGQRQVSGSAICIVVCWICNTSATYGFWNIGDTRTCLQNSVWWDSQLVGLH